MMLESVGIIGGADGPTAVFITHNGIGLSTILIGAGLLLLGVGIVAVLLHNHKK